MTDYGTDVYCVTGFLASMPEISGRTAIAHVAARGLQTPNGRFSPWPDWGEDLRQYVLSKHPPVLIAAKARRQILKDERVRTCKVTAERLDRTIDLTVYIVPEEGGPFAFVLTITEAATTLVPLQEAV